MAWNYDYDYVVIGVGGIGSGTLYWLSRLAPPNSSDINSPAFIAYEYMQLLKFWGLNSLSLVTPEVDLKTIPESYEKCTWIQSMQALRLKVMIQCLRWREVEQESGLKLLHTTGGITWTTPDAGHENTVMEYEKSGRKAGSPVRILNGKEIMARWPQFQIPPSATGVFDPEAGLVDAGLGNAAHQQCAIARGAEVWRHCKVTKLEKLHGGGMKVVTSKGDVRCKKAIVTSGAWINQVLESCGLHIPVTVTQENVTYYATPHLKHFVKENFPVFFYMGKNANLYALPVHGVAGFKIGIDAGGPSTTGDTRTFQPDPKREKICSDFLKEYLPQAFGRVIETKTCLYTMTYDRAFIIDTLKSKNYPDVIVCCGAGHAFKFAALFGKVLSEMAIFGESKTEVKDFGINRPAIMDPNFTPDFHQMAPQSSQAKL